MQSDGSNLIWKALSDPTRRKLLDLLKDKPQTTGDLCEHFRHMTRFAVMKHLKVLEQSNLVIVKWEGNFRWNHLNAVPIQQIYERWVSKYSFPFANALTRLKDHIESEDKNESGISKNTNRTRNNN